ncbi:tRNA 2-thiouridine(34) synthase MnmA [Candidatus Dojkabacteria bacterium]|uniref:tRNA-specific 2-thiouridylase MnmA n=1 Tax=Candidatus Dojkabacteria bacterium TaxID=2099670 RepID=A0A955RL27_9BACT|nr:tRNA 2-thiouridine(34) synthase MnmA [Candidatus Dojkabacteria bacterium]
MQVKKDQSSFNTSELRPTSNSKTKVFVALSGGVDSAVSAALLKEQGYDVTGVYMKNWSGDDFGIQADCPWDEDQTDAASVCKHLGIPFRSFNFERHYREKVVEYFFDEYSKGRTPNPDVMCNKEIKFKLFLNKAISEGADLIATGHYAQVKKEGETYKLLAGKDNNKNQVYFLYSITQDQLSKTLFPVGHLEKSEVRKLADKFGLPNKNKPDSQGICFIGEIDVLKFLMANIPKKHGKIVDIETNQEVGEHEGIYFYTIGQRAKIPNQTQAYYFCAKDLDLNIMYVCHGENNNELLKSVVEVEDWHWIGNPPSKVELSGVIRYRQKTQSGKIDIKNKKFIFDKPQRAVASGQSLVIFEGTECLGGGIIV